MSLLFPWNRLTCELQTEIVSAKIDGDDIPPDLLDSEARTIEIRAIGRETWSAVEIELAVILPIQELRGRDIADDDLSVLLQLSCNGTRLRATERLDVRGGKAVGSVSFKRDLVVDRVLVSTILCERGSDDIPRILKEGPSWDLIIAEPMRSPAPPHRPKGIKGLPSELFETTWTDFDKVEKLRPYSNELFFVDVSQEDRPKLYLNEGIDNYRFLLADSPGSSTFEKMLRDAEGARIASAALFAAIVQALENITVEAETSEVTLPSGWQRAIIDDILGRYRPNQDTQVTAEEIARRRQDQGSIAVLLGELQSVISRKLDITTVIKRNITRVGQYNTDEEQA